jgi:hypothetical protein
MTELHSRDLMFRIHGHPLWPHPPNGQKNLGRSVFCICGRSIGSKVQNPTPNHDRAELDSLTPSRTHRRSLDEPVLAIALRLARFNEPLDAPQAAVVWISFVAEGHFLGRAGIWKQSLLPVVGRVDSVVRRTLPGPHRRQPDHWRLSTRSQVSCPAPSCPASAGTARGLVSRGGRASHPVGRVPIRRLQRLCACRRNGTGYGRLSEGARGRPLP